MNYNLLEVSEFKITKDHSLQDKKFHITPEIKQILQEMNSKAKKGAPNIIKKLRKYCHRYPWVPQFKNFLCVVYENAGFDEKLLKLGQQTVKEHPDYLFGKITYAAILIKEEEPEKVPDILGEKMDIKALYPDRDVFHLKEVLGFLRVCVLYYLAIDEPESVLPYIRAMKEIGPDEPQTEDAKSRWMNHLAAGTAHRIKKQNERRRSVESRPYDKSIQTDQKPVFNHPEIGALYSNDIRIDHSIIRKILELPRETLIKDLEEVVEDSIRRFEYFRDLNKQYGEWHDEEFSFILHALFLLAELKAGESLPVVLRLFRQGEELLEFWFSDLLTQMIPEVFYHLVQAQQLNELQNFMQEPDNFAYARNAVQQAVAQFALLQPEHRSEVVEWFGNLFQYFLDNPENVRIADSDLVSFMVVSAIDLDAVELESMIRDLYNHDLHFVEKGIVGSLEDVLTDMKSKHYRSEKYKTYDIFSRYNHLTKIWYPEQERKLSPFETALQGSLNDKQQSQDQPVQVSQKVGRNDPCPCGSGKKYKYCCMK